MARVKVQPHMIEWALYRSGKEEKVLASLPMIPKWIDGEKEPTLKQLQAFAKATHTPFGYLFMSQPPKDALPVPHFRTLDTDEPENPSPNLIDTIRTMERRKDWMKEYLIENGHSPLPFVGSADISKNPKEVAENIRETLGLSEKWAANCRNWEEALKFLFNKVEDAGILVMKSGTVGSNTRRPLSVEEFRGFVLIDDYAPLVFINGVDGKAAQLFTIAHELAHVWYGKGGIFDLTELQPADSAIEIACNQTAAEFLVPEHLFINEWKTNQHLDDRYRLTARFFKVSEIVIARRALDLSLISKEEFFEFYKGYKERLKEMKKNAASGQGNFYNNVKYNTSHRFARALTSSASSGEVLFTEACRLSGLSPKAFNNFSKIVEGY